MKNPHAVALGKLSVEKMSPEERAKNSSKGGLAGGPARAQSLSKARRRAIAKKAAAARWGKRRKEGKT